MLLLELTPAATLTNMCAFACPAPQILTKMQQQLKETGTLPDTLGSELLAQGGSYGNGSAWVPLHLLVAAAAAAANSSPVGHVCIAHACSPNALPHGRCHTAVLAAGIALAGCVIIVHTGAMRVAPLGLAYRNASVDGLQEALMQTLIPTHHVHPWAVEGALAQALAVAHLSKLQPAPATACPASPTAAAAGAGAPAGADGSLLAGSGTGGSVPAGALELLRGLQAQLQGRSEVMCSRLQLMEQGLQQVRFWAGCEECRTPASGCPVPLEELSVYPARTKTDEHTHFVLNSMCWRFKFESSLNAHSSWTYLLHSPVMCTPPLPAAPAAVCNARRPKAAPHSLARPLQQPSLAAGAVNSCGCCP
jgi:hypothetical protein